MYYVNENIRDLYRVKCTDDRSNVLRLDMNENPVGLPKEFVEDHTGIFVNISKQKRVNILNSKE